MGLDMFLQKEIYVLGDKSGKINIKENGKAVKVNLKRLVKIIEEIGCWRKANHIHKWFVDNIQNGIDDCEPHYVSFEKLKELEKLCEKVLKDKKPELLPPHSGFFFGNTTVGDWYYSDIKDTLKFLKRVKKGDLVFYKASW